jgi:four helix bundle protein
MPEGWKAHRLGSQEAGRLVGKKAIKPGSLKVRSIRGEGLMQEERWAKLEVWKLADELAYKIYTETRSFPKEEIYGITSQIRRAALSIPTNIVEGYSRKGDKELAHFVNISLGSLGEVKYLIYFSNRLGYFQDAEYKELRDGYNALGKMLWKFYDAIRDK